MYFKVNRFSTSIYFCNTAHANAARRANANLLANANQNDYANANQNGKILMFIYGEKSAS